MAAKKTVAKTVKKEPVQQEPPRPDIFESLGNKAVWVALGLIFLLAFIVFKDFLLGDKIYLYKDICSDSVNASWPWMVHSADYISQYGTPSWSFSMGMGQNILSFSCYDPFDYLLYPFGRDTMPYLIIYKELAKILLSGFLIFKFLKLLKMNNYVSILGALMYSFSGYMILGSGWFLFSFEVFNAALLLYAFELLYQRGKWWLFVLPIFFIGISRPFNFWLYGVFLAAYILFRIVLDDKKIISKDTIVLFGKIVGVSLLGLGLSAPLLLEQLQVIIDSPRGSGPDSYSATISKTPMFGTPDKVEFGTDVMRFFSNDMLGSGINFRGWTNFLEAPEFYFGIPCLILFSQVFQFLKKNEKRAAIILLVIWLIPIFFPYFRKAFYLFTGDYYRSYSFFVGFIFLLYSMIGLNRMLTENRMSVRALLITTGIWLVLLNYPYFPEKGLVQSGIKLFANVALISYAAIVYFMGKNRSNANYKYALIALLFVELCWFSYTTVHKRDNANGIGNLTAKNLKEKVWYNDYTLDAVDYLKKTDKSFYRLDKNFVSTPAIHGSLNDAMVQGYYSTPSYNPFNQKGYIDYMKTMGVINKVNEYESRWSAGLINRFILESLNDVKYILAIRDARRSYSQPTWKITHDSLTQIGDVVVLKNRFNLPLGFGYDKYMKLSVFDALSPAQKDYVSTKACVVNDEDEGKVSRLSEFHLKDTVAPNLFTFDLLKQNLDTLRKNTMQITEFKPTLIKGSITLPAARMVYFSIPSDKGWSIKENGQALDKFVLSGGMTGVVLGAGTHNLELQYESLNYNKGKTVAFVTLPVLLGLVFFTLRKKKKIETSAIN